MTTTASKYGKRTAAAERTKKHAQRTPLPPKAGRQKSPAELEGERGETRAAVKRVRKPANKTTTTADTARKKATGVGTKAPAVRPSLAKAERFAEYATAGGWAVEYCGPSENMKADCVKVTRGGETIIVGWEGTLWVYDSSAYLYGGTPVKIRNASAARAKIDAPAGSATASRPYRAKGSAEPSRARQVKVPWSDGATAEDILAAVDGKKLVWLNKISGEYEEERVLPNAKRIEVTEDRDGNQILTFPAYKGSIRSVRVCNIVQVR